MEPLERARELEGAGRHAEAVEACREAVAAGLRQEGYEAMADSYEAAGMHEKAAESLQRASREPSLRRAELLHRAGRYEKAAAEAGRILKDAPGEPGALALKARSLILLNRHAEALRCCADSSDPRVLAAKGRALYETGKNDEAASCCERARSAPGFAARYYAALATGSKERYAEAAGCEPDDVDSPRARMGLVMWRLGRTEEALGELGRGDGPKSACTRGRVLKELGRDAEAAAAFRDAAGRRAENWEDLYCVGLACHMLGLDGDARWHQKAARALKAAQARNRSGPGISELLDATEGQIGRRRTEAEEKLRAPKPKAAPPARPKRKPAAKKRRPRAAPAPQARAPAAQEIVGRAAELCSPGSCERALAVLGELSVPEQQGAAAQFCKGTAYYGLARYEEAQACFERAGSGLEALYWSAMSLFRLGRTGMLEVEHTQKFQRYRDARRLLARILGADPSYPGARALAGLVDHNMHMSNRTSGPDESERSFREALKDRPGDAVALYHLGQALERAGEAREAGAMYDRAAESAPGGAAFDSEPHYCKGYSLDLRGQHETALSVYLDAFARDPDYGPGFAEEMREARGSPPRPHRNVRHPADAGLDVCVVDTNIALPHLVRALLPGDVREWMNLAYHRRRFWGRLEEGSYIIPGVCRGEILSQLRGGFLARYAPRADRALVIDGVRARLDGLPRTRWSEEAGGAGPRDVDRIRRAYWRAWFGMAREDKERWACKKRRGGRRLAGGPPLGTRDAKILAVAARLAEGGSSVGLVTDDNDFLMFGAAIKELGVDVVEV